MLLQKIQGLHITVSSRISIYRSVLYPVTTDRIKKITCKNTIRKDSNGNDIAEKSESFYEYETVSQTEPMLRLFEHLVEKGLYHIQLNHWCVMQSITYLTNFLQAVGGPQQHGVNVVQP
jgi:hypothetical protein